MIKLIKCHIGVSDGIFIFIFGLLAHQYGPLRIFGNFSDFWIKIGFLEEACSLFMHDNSERNPYCVILFHDHFYLQSHDDGNRETAEEGDARNDALRLVSDVNAGAGGGEVEHVAGGAGLDGVEGTVALAGVRVPHLVGRDTLRPVLRVVTDTPAVQNTTVSLSTTLPPSY